MTPRQIPNEAAMLGLLSAQMGGGIFGGGRRRTRPLRDGAGATGPGGLGDPLNPAAAPAMTASPYAAPQVDAPPPITAAPPPPADWASQLGPELLGNLPQQTLPTQTLPQSPPTRGGLLANRGMFGSAAPRQPVAMGAGIGSAMQRGADGMTDETAGAMPKKQGIDWRMIAGIVGDALGGLNGQPPMYAQAMYKERAARADQQRQLAEITLRSRLDAAKPDYFTVNNDRVRYDPTTGATETLYTAQEDFDRYAAALGAEPGTPEYDRLVQDYVLRSAGPTASDFNIAEEENRQENRIGLEGVRQGNRRELLDQRFSNSRALKGAPTYRQANPVAPKPRASGGGRRGARGGAPSLSDIPEGATGRDANGVRYIKRGGKLVPIK